MPNTTKTFTSEVEKFLVQAIERANANAMRAQAAVVSATHSMMAARAAKAIAAVNSGVDVFYKEARSAVMEAQRQAEEARDVARAVTGMVSNPPCQPEAIAAYQQYAWVVDQFATSSEGISVRAEAASQVAANATAHAVKAVLGASKPMQNDEKNGSDSESQKFENESCMSEDEKQESSQIKHKDDFNSESYSSDESQSLVFEDSEQSPESLDQRFENESPMPQGPEDEPEEDKYGSDREDQRSENQSPIPQNEEHNADKGKQEANDRKYDVVLPLDSQPANDQSTITHLVLSGGGAKGVFYPGAIDALSNTSTGTRIFQSIEEISGASAGAIAAALIAVGVSADELRRQAIEVDIKKLMGGMRETDGSALLAFIRKSILESVTGHLEKLLSDNKKGIQLLSSEQLECAKRILLSIKGGVVEEREHRFLRKPSPFTFGNLRELNEQFPHVFKKLRVVAFFEPKKGPGRSEFFDVNNPENANVEVALACRASAALPGKLDPVEINGKRYRDGGLMSNIPVEGYDPKNTLVFVLDEKGQNMNAPINQVLYGHSFDRKFKQLFEEAFEGRDKALLSSEKSRPDASKKRQIFESIYRSIEKKLYKEIQEWEICLMQLNEFAKTLSDSPELNTKENQVLLKNRIEVEEKKLINAHKQKHKMLNLLGEAFEKISVELEKNNNRYDAIWDKRTVGEQLQAAADVMVAHLNPVTNANTLRNRAIDVFISKGAGIKMEMTATEAYVEYCKRIRPFQYVVQMDTTGLIATSSEDAALYARELMACGYLDTINCVVNHNLCSSSFPVEKFYTDVLENFLSMSKCFSSVLLNEERVNIRKITSRKLALQKVENKYSKGEIGLFICQDEIRGVIGNRFSSVEAFVLSRAIEVWQGRLTKQALKNEIIDKIKARYEFIHKIPMKASKLLAVTYAVDKTIEHIQTAQLPVINQKKEQDLPLPIKSQIPFEKDFSKRLSRVHAASLEQISQMGDINYVKSVVVDWASTASAYQKSKKNKLWLMITSYIAKRVGTESVNDQISALVALILEKNGDLHDPAIVNKINSIGDEENIVLKQVKELYEFYTVHHKNFYFARVNQPVASTVQHKKYAAGCSTVSHTTPGIRFLPENVHETIVVGNSLRLQI